MKKIRKMNSETGKVNEYTSLNDAAKSVYTKMDLWKVELLIQDAIKHNKRAFKCKWQVKED